LDDDGILIWAVFFLFFLLLFFLFFFFISLFFRFLSFLKPTLPSPLYNVFTRTIFCFYIAFPFLIFTRAICINLFVNATNEFTLIIMFVP